MILKDVNYFQVDEKSFIPIVNIGSALRGRIKGYRPKEAYIRVTQESLSSVFESEVNQKRFLDWLAKGILPALEIIKKEGE
jgi:hypothetical protein